MEEYLLVRNFYDVNDIKKFASDLVERHHLKIIHDKSKIKRYSGSFTSNIKDIAVISEDIPTNEYITDYFVEEVRCESYNVNFKSPKSYFDQDKQKWMRIFVNKTRNVSERDKYHIFRKMMKDGVKRDCGLFPIDIVLSVYKFFKPKRILDMCSGWGDRLIGAMLYGAESYVGFDPNSNLEPKYVEMVNQFGDGRHNNYKVHKLAFEDAKDDHFGEDFDLMFSSPPYFVAEQYSNDKDQSHNRYKSLDDWIYFMFASISLAWKHLKIGGHYCLVLSDVQINWKEYNYTDKILRHVSKQQGSKYIGLLKYKQPTTVQPIWMFEKN